jgi:hypothetical protein
VIVEMTNKKLFVFGIKFAEIPFANKLSWLSNRAIFHVINNMINMILFVVGFIIAFLPFTFVVKYPLN